MIAAVNRLPDSTRKPASSRSGWSNGRITFSSSIVASRQLSPIERPVAVIAASAVRPLRLQLVTPRRPAAGVVVVLAEVFAGRLQVDEQRHLVADRLPVAHVQL